MKEFQIGNKTYILDEPKVAQWVKISAVISKINILNDDTIIEIIGKAGSQLGYLLEAILLEKGELPTSEVNEDKRKHIEAYCDEKTAEEIIQGFFTFSSVLKKVSGALGTIGKSLSILENYANEEKQTQEKTSSEI